MRFLRVFSLFLLFLCHPNFLFAQEVEEEKMTIEPELNFRSFWMNTSYTNEAFKSDYALGVSLLVGGKITWRKKWEVQTSYRLFGNALSSPFWEPDSLTGQANRYESGLFDLLHPKDRFFGRLEGLSFAYATSNFGLKLGKMGIQSDWVNAQDGRLSPTAVEGIHAWVTPSSRWKIRAWGIHRLNIRGSKDWLPVGETLGIFPQGRTSLGKSSTYFGNTTGPWLGIWELEGKVGVDAAFRFSHTYASNLFATYWTTFEKVKKNKAGLWSSGVQAGLQHGLGEGGNADPQQQYKDPRDSNAAVSAKINWKKGSWELQLSATRVGGRGRWLSPREWGKDAWYTFIPRERNEGFETVSAGVLYVSYHFEKLPLQVYSYLGMHVLPDPKDAAANKYNFPSYRQQQFGIRYATKKIKNLEIHLLALNKEPVKNEALPPIQVYNKVGFWHVNGILNWKLIGK